MNNTNHAIKYLWLMIGVLNAPILGSTKTLNAMVKSPLPYVVLILAAGIVIPVPGVTIAAYNTLIYVFIRVVTTQNNDCRLLF